MGFQIGPSEIVLLLVVAALFLGRHRLRQLGMRSEEIERLGAELGHRTPAYSAETTQGKEAEFIRDRLPKRFPYWLVLIGALAVGALLWWLSHR
jgi:type VI protein secretion system component VasF